jgi:acyl carrier protein
LSTTEKTEAEITAWCVAHLAAALRQPAEKIESQTKFARLGVDSAMAVYLVGELEEWLGRELAPELAFEYPTIAALARHLAGEPG